MNVLVADDHALFAAGLAGVLTRISDEALQTTSVGSVEEAATALGALDYDLVLLDLFMPGMDGVKGLRRLADAAPTTPVVIVSASTDPHHASLALEAGAAGYVAKSATPDLLVSALRAVLEEGETPVIGLDAEDEAAQDLAVLTRRQREIAECVARGLTNRQIAEATGITEGTVKLHVSGILKALGLRNRASVARLLGRRPPV